MKIWLIITVIHTTLAVKKLKPEKTSGMIERDQTHDLCDTTIVLYQLAKLWVCNIHVSIEGEEYIQVNNESSYIWTVENDMKIWLIIAVMHT